MPISALVVTLSEAAPEREEALRALRSDPRIEVGDPTGIRYPVVTDTATLAEQDSLTRTMDEMPGVVLLELVFHDFSDADDFGAVPRRGRRRPAMGG